MSRVCRLGGEQRRLFPGLREYEGSTNANLSVAVQLSGKCLGRKPSWGQESPMVEHDKSDRSGDGEEDGDGDEDGGE